MATAHLLLRIIYHMLQDRVPYQELGWEYVPNPTRGVEYWIRKIESQGFTVQLEPHEITST
ncbi:hypothetical protein ADA01nite_23860 [Aneurinibacillus danicus]|jgi:hypothetical protein|uniref:Uncharacterized protein n=1 Tax=Aneurinibacillus danicus TaxID=267746 RepID=A0A511V7I6_9BACL|nr:hypothetical protein ADA01nite_23860 [Aneurinibacillus danicus]